MLWYTIRCLCLLSFVFSTVPVHLQSSETCGDIDKALADIYKVFDPKSH